MLTGTDTQDIQEQNMYFYYIKYSSNVLNYYICLYFSCKVKVAPCNQSFFTLYQYFFVHQHTCKYKEIYFYLLSAYEHTDFSSKHFSTKNMTNKKLRVKHKRWASVNKYKYSLITGWTIMWPLNQNSGRLIANHLRSFSSLMSSAAAQMLRGGL